LVERGADINKINKRGETLLFYGCSIGDEAIVKHFKTFSGAWSKYNKVNKRVENSIILCENNKI